jgi:DNA modification methylase
MTTKQIINENYAIYNADCVQVCSSLKDDSIDFSIFSPPFADLYCYSDSPMDMGNCSNYGDFFDHFGFLVKELSRIIKPGRNVAVHCMDIPSMKERDGVIGIKDFSGDIIRLFQKFGFIYHSRHTIWKDPLIEATRTKAIGLMHKQLQKDSIMSRAGLPDYLLCFRNKGENQNPIVHPEGLTEYAGSDNPSLNHAGIQKSHNIWRSYASPVWMDIRQTNTLNARIARDDDDEKHLCPLQLDVIERAVTLWSNENEVVLTPFMGVGSEVYQSVILNRRSIGVELKESYFNQAFKNIDIALTNRKIKNQTLFDKLS